VLLIAYDDFASRELLVIGINVEARAENQASIMENQLATLEQKLDAFLAEHDGTDGEEATRATSGNGEASSDRYETENPDVPPER